jgi:hypothetical protein
MKRFPIQFLQSLLIFSAILVWGCSPNTTLSTNPCVGLGNDCDFGNRLVYFEITVTPPLPVTTPGPNEAKNIRFSLGPPPGIGYFTWNSTVDAKPLSTFTTPCWVLSPGIQHQIFAHLSYSSDAPWLGQCHSVDVKAFSPDGSLLDSWFVPSMGVFVESVSPTQGPFIRVCHDTTSGYNNFHTGSLMLGTLVVPDCP